MLPRRRRCAKSDLRGGKCIGQGRPTQKCRILNMAGLVRFGLYHALLRLRIAAQATRQGRRRPRRRRQRAEPKGSPQWLCHASTPPMCGQRNGAHSVDNDPLGSAPACRRGSDRRSVVLRLRSFSSRFPRSSRNRRRAYLKIAMRRNTSPVSTIGKVPRIRCVLGSLEKFKSVTVKQITATQSSR